MKKSTSIDPASKKSSQFLFYLEEFNKFLVDITDKKITVTLSLKELSTLQSVKSLLDQVHYLNLVYNENSKIKKYFIQRNIENYQLEEKLYKNIDFKLNSFVDDLDKNFDSLRLQIINKELNEKTAIEFLRNMSYITLKSQDFLILEKENDSSEDEYSFFSTCNEFMHGDINENFLHKLFISTLEYHEKNSKGKYLFEMKDIYEEIFSKYKMMEISQKSDEIYKTNFSKKNTLVLYLKENDKNLIIYFLNNEKEKSRLLYQNINQESLQTIGSLFKSMVMSIRKDIFSKQHMCSILDELKNSLLSNAKDICTEIIKNEIKETLNCPVDIIKQNTEKFKNYQKSSKDIYDVILDDKRIVIPIVEFEGVAFLISIEDFSLDIHTFIDKISKKWSFIAHILQSLKERHVYLQLFQQDLTKLYFLFNERQELIYQNREVPSKLKPHVNYREEGDGRVKLKNLFAKDPTLLQSIEKHIEILRKSKEYYRSNASKPGYEIAVRRKDNQEIEYFIVNIFNTNKMIVKTNEYQVIEKKIKLPNEKKMAKYTNAILSYCKIDYPLDFREICVTLIEKSREKQIKFCSPMLKSHSDSSSEISFITDYSNVPVLQPPTFKRRTKEKKLSHILNADPTTRKKEKTRTTIVKASVFKRESSQDIISENKFGKMSEISEDLLAPPYENFDSLNKELTKLNDWNLNVWAFPTDKDKFKSIWAMFQAFNYFEKIEIDQTRFPAFLNVIRDKYNVRNNPFHNFDHGFTVCHNVYYILQKKILNKYLIDVEMFSLLLAALCHDVDHTGRTNAFEAASYSTLALKYNDESILENHHSALTFKLLCDNDYNIFFNVANDNFKYIRKYMISNILHTDMKRHFESLNAFDIKYKEFMDDPDTLYNNEAGKKLISGVIIHACDLYSSTKKFPLAKEWAIRINQEFTNQIKNEKDLGLPQTAYMLDLEKPAIMAKQEMQFIKVIQKPLWEKVNIFLEDTMKEAYNQCEENIQEWEKIFKNN